MQIGKEQGMQLGEELALEKIAKQMLAEQLDPALISRVTGFSPDKIDRLRQQYFD